MDAPPPVPPAGQPAFPTAPLQCTLPDVTAELLHELDTDVIPAIANTSFSLDLRNATSLSTSPTSSASAGRLSVEIADATDNGSPCYQIMASLLLRAGGSVPEKTSVQVIANVSTQLDTLRESRVVTVGGKVRHTRNVWGVGITPPGSTRVSSAVAGSASRSISSGSKPVSATMQRAPADQQLESANLDEYLSTVPEDTTTHQEEGGAHELPDTFTIAPIASDPTQPPSAGPSTRTSSARPTSARPTSARPTSARPPSSSPAPPPPQLAAAAAAAPRPHYLVQHQSMTLAGSPDDADDLVTSTSTHLLDHAQCPGLLFSGSQLIFLLLVALHVQSTGLSTPEVFVTHAYADNPDEASVVTLTSDPVRPQVVCGLARKLAGVRVDKTLSKPGEARCDMVGHGSQWYFAPWAVGDGDENRPRSAADAIGEHAGGGGGDGLELVAVLRVAGAEGVVTDPRAVVGTHPADDGELGGAMEVQSMYYDLKAEEEQNLDSVLHTRPELTAMLTDFMRAVLVKKPKDVYAFAGDHFTLPQH